MGSRADFDDASWHRLQLAQFAAGAVAALADRGTVDIVREMFAVHEAVNAAAHADSWLVRALAADPGDAKALQVIGDGDVEELLTLVRHGADVVQAHAADQIDAFVAHLTNLATAAARATRTGGFLGIGAEEISIAEQAAIDAVRHAARG
jgi:hypothetical protein